jgi:DNA invertase Pin-like site-specific DNA recombinase
MPSVGKLELREARCLPGTDKQFIYGKRSVLALIAMMLGYNVAIGEKLDAKGVSLKVLEQAIDTSTPTGRLMFNMLGAIAQFERELMLERQREASRRLRPKGRAPIARAKAAEVRRLCIESIGPTEIAKRLQISRASVYRVFGA